MIILGNLLGLIFLLWLPILIGIYFFKSRPVRHKISSLYLWKKVHQKRRNHGFFEKFKNNLIFWLQLIFFFLLFMALSKPYFKNKESYKKQIYIIDNSGSMIARSGLFETRLNSSLQLVRKHAKGLKKRNIEVYKWNSKLQKINIDGNLEVKLSLVQPSHLPNGDFFDLINEIKNFIGNGYKIAIFTDSLEYEEQFNLSNLGVEVFLSAQNNRNIFFESIDGNLLNNGKLKFNIKIACTSLGGNGNLLVSQKGALPRRIPFKLKEYDNEQFNFEIEPVSFSEPIRFELLPDEPDLLFEDNLVEYFIDSRIPRIALFNFLESDLFSKIFKSFLSSDERFLLNNKQFQIRFIKVRKLPSNPQALCVYIVEGNASQVDFQESKSHILESAHPLMKYIGGNKFSAVKNLNFSSNDSEWNPLIQIEKKIAKTNTPGLLIHKSLPACILLNLEFNSHSIGNADYPILLENILRYMLQELRMSSLFEVGAKVNLNEGTVALQSAPGNKFSKLIEITLQGVYKSSDGFNYFARFPVTESRLKNVERNPALVPIKTYSKISKESNETIEKDDSIFSGLLIVLALIFMIYEWYLFSRRA